MALNERERVEPGGGPLQKAAVFMNLEMVITLDLTKEHYRSCHFTVENCFVKQDNGLSLLQFGNRGDLKTYLSEMIHSTRFVEDADGDESWQYDEHDLNCFSLCLPCRLLGHDMHDDAGVAIAEDSLAGYMDSLVRFTTTIHQDLAGKALQRTAKRRR